MLISVVGQTNYNLFYLIGLELLRITIMLRLLGTEDWQDLNDAEWDFNDFECRFNKDRILIHNPRIFNAMAKIKRQHQDELDIQKQNFQDLLEKHLSTMAIAYENKYKEVALAYVNKCKEIASAQANKSNEIELAHANKCNEYKQFQEWYKLEFYRKDQEIYGLKLQVEELQKTKCDKNFEHVTYEKKEIDEYILSLKTEIAKLKEIVSKAHKPLMPKPLHQRPKTLRLKLNN